jgi:hypothetical protein
MRRILVIRELVPFAETPSAKIAETLARALRSTETDVECIALPASARSVASLDDLVARRALDVWNVDRLIALAFPACLVAHPHKIVWFADERELPTGSPALALAMREAKRVYTADAAARKRLYAATRCRSRVLSVPRKESLWARVAAELLR